MWKIHGFSSFWRCNCTILGSAQKLPGGHACAARRHTNFVHIFRFLVWTAWRWDRTARRCMTFITVPLCCCEFCDNMNSSLFLDVLWLHGVIVSYCLDVCELIGIWAGKVVIKIKRAFWILMWGEANMWLEVVVASGIMPLLMILVVHVGSVI